MPVSRVPAATGAALAAILACPRCRSPLDLGGERVFCTAASCAYATRGFPILAGTPALIDFDRSIIAEDRLAAAQGGLHIDRAPSLRQHVRGLVLGGNPVAAKNCDAFLAGVRALNPRPL